MPFELGLDVGCRLFGAGRGRTKRCLILETERYRYQAALSDLSNSDIAVHGDEPIRIFSEVRNWLSNQSGLEAPGPSRIWGAFLEFTSDNFSMLKDRGFSDEDIRKLPISELMNSTAGWVSRHPFVKR